MVINEDERISYINSLIALKGNVPCKKRTAPAPLSGGRFCHILSRRQLLQLSCHQPSYPPPSLPCVPSVSPLRVPLVFLRVPRGRQLRRRSGCRSAPADSLRVHPGVVRRSLHQPRERGGGSGSHYLRAAGEEAGTPDHHPPPPPPNHTPVLITSAVRTRPRRTWFPLNTGW